MSARRTAALGALALLAATPAPAAAQSPPRTTSYGVVGGDRSRGYDHRLDVRPGWRRVVRDDLAAPGRKGRQARRRSLLYFAQLSDFQLADEESPARAENLDGIVADSAWRPQEAFSPFIVDEAVRQVNRFDRSPIRHRRTRRARLALTITTGDSADNQQVNETGWVVRLLEGGRLDPNSGVEGSLCGGLVPPGEAARYTGVQDDHDVPDSERFYDPDRPTGPFAGWPQYPGLMDRAQLPFDAEGLRRPSYVAFGNHDGYPQGTVHGNVGFDAIVTGCVKPLVLAGFAPASLVTSLQRTVLVPADPRRAFADKATYKRLHSMGEQADDHGFAHVDPGELRGSDGDAGYYAFSPRKGIRFIALDTVADGDLLASTGNIDHPQWRWLVEEIRGAEERDELIVLYGHHPIRSLRNEQPDENVGDCANPLAGSDCDRDPRISRPLHLGPDLQRLLLAHPHVIAYVAGHTHEHNIQAFDRPDDSGGFWGIETASETDWPIQSRLLEIMDNRDGSLSIFGTAIDHASTLDTPQPGTPAAGFSRELLASLGREFSFNDPQVGAPGGEGEPRDRNVELLIEDPRRAR